MITESRKCVVCYRVFHRRYTEGMERFVTRKTCSRECAASHKTNVFRHAHGLPTVGEAKRDTPIKPRPRPAPKVSHGFTRALIREYSLSRPGWRKMFRAS